MGRTINFKFLNLISFEIQSHSTLFPGVGSRTIPISLPLKTNSDLLDITGNE